MLQGRGLSGSLQVTGFTGETQRLTVSDDTLEMPLDGGPRYLPLPASVSSLVAHGLEVAPCERSLRVTARRCGAGRVKARLAVRHGQVVRTQDVTIDEATPAGVELPISWPW